MGDLFTDPPRQGWRGGAPMDGFTACQRRGFPLSDVLANYCSPQIIFIRIFDFHFNDIAWF